MKLVIAEKPSVAQSIARVIGAAGRKDGYLTDDMAPALSEWLTKTGRAFAKRPKQHRQESRVSLLIDVQQKLQTKGPGYARWAKIHNLKEMSKSLLFLREHGFETMEQLDAFIAEKTERRDKRPPGTRSQNASFVHKGLGLSQQVLRPSERGRRPGGDPGPCLRGSL